MATKKITHKIAKGRKIEPLDDDKVKEIIIEESTYAFKSWLNGLFWYISDDGNSERIEPGEIRDDITENERKKILKTDAYKMGYVTEESITDIAEPESSPNALNNEQIKLMLQEPTRKIRHRIMNDIDSVMTLTRIKDAAMVHAKSPVIPEYCNARISELIEAETEKKKAPLASLRPPREGEEE